MPITSNKQEELTKQAFELSQRYAQDARKTPAGVAGMDAIDRAFNIGSCDAGQFEKLERKLAQEPGISDPAAVAAKIGREKLGQAEMTRRSVAGREK
jgi:hypothetical protein